MHHPQRDPHEVRDPVGEAWPASKSHEGVQFSKYGKFQNLSDNKVKSDKSDLPEVYGHVPVGVLEAVLPGHVGGVDDAPAPGHDRLS